MKRAFECCALPSFESVKAQESPDADFPTVIFPNPEEKGAYNFLQEKAGSITILIVLSRAAGALVRVLIP